MSINQNAVGGSFTTVDTVPKFRPGTTMKGAGDDEYVYVEAAATITGATYVVGIDEDYEATMLAAAAGGALGDAVGVAKAAAAAGEYLWVQVRGTCDVRVAASCAANVVLAATATAGQIDDAVGKTVERLVLTTARAASAGPAPARLMYPTVGATTT